MFSTGLKTAWLVTVALISALELIPFHSEGMPSPVFYSWQLLKFVLFLAVGWETPLTFWQSKRLATGLFLACVSAGVIEGLQLMIVGHRFSLLELVAKSAVLFAGFAIGLVARHDETIGFGRFKIKLIPKASAKLVS